MSKILTIFGATGNQGLSIIEHVLADPILSTTYTIRAITRNPNQPAAQSLAAKGSSIQVVQADLDDAASIQTAVQGAHTVFGITTTIYDNELKTREVRQGRCLADTCVDAGVTYLIWSTLSSPTVESGGKYSNVDSFDCKAEVEAYIRGLSPKLKSAFFAPGSFMSNLTGNPRALQPSGDGTSYTIANVIRPDSPMPMIDIRADTGKYVGAILAEPDKFEGKVLSAATEFYSFDDVARIISRVTGKTVRYQQIPVEVFKGFLPPDMAECLVEMMLYAEECGYYGSETKGKVAWTVENARGELTTLEEHVRRNPPVSLV